MSQNPYTPRDPFAAAATVDGPSRVSGLAVGSLITSLFCCIPGVGAVAVVLGIASIVGISRAQGRLSGRGLAFTGIVLGVLGTMLWIGLAIGLTQLPALMRPYFSTMTAIESGEPARARGQMTPQAGAVSDERLAEFREEYRGSHGAFKEFPTGIVGIFGGYFSMGPKMQVVEEAERLNPGKRLMPMPATFENGPGLVIFVLDRSSGQIENLGVAGQGQGIVWLFDPAARGSPPP